MKAAVKDSPAFSLVELLVVIAIIALLAVMAMPAFTQVLRATRLTTTGQAIADELNAARQTALSRNVTVEVRYYKLPDESASPAAAPSIYRAQQSFIIQGDSTNAIGKPTYLSSPVVFSTNTTESAFFSSTNHLEQTAPAGATVPGYGVNYLYRSFRFSPNGSVDLQNSDNYFTLVLQNDKLLTAGANFFTLQINPISGSVRSFRP